MGRQAAVPILGLFGIKLTERSLKFHKENVVYEYLIVEIRDFDKGKVISAIDCAEHSWFGIPVDVYPGMRWDYAKTLNMLGNGGWLLQTTTSFVTKNGIQGWTYIFARRVAAG